MPLINEIRSELVARVDPEYREGCRNFFKEPVDPWGVRSADLKAVEAFAYKRLRPLPKDARYELFEQLWAGGKLEEGAMVCHLGRKFKREFDAADFKRFERWIDLHVHNWSHCDGIASWLLAGCIANQPTLINKLIPWTRAKNRWKRRASAVSLLQEAKQGRSMDSICDIAKRMESDEDVMVLKGVGWLLKETYPRRPEETLEFLRLNQFPRIVVRYAAEKMTKADRAELGLG